MDVAGPYRIDGNSYSREELADHCRRTAMESGVPNWYRKVFSFINQFMDSSTGPILQRSSGTTGNPKEFEMERNAMAVSARKTLSFFNLQPGHRVLLCLPSDYIAGKMMVVRALVGGLDLVLTEPSGRPLEGMSGEFSFTAMVPMQVHDSLKAGDDLSILRKLLIGGAALHPVIKEKLEQMHPPAAFESFAMTETYTHFAIRKINGPAPESGFQLLDGVGVTSDDRGCLVVDVPGITSGPVVTNDLVEIEAGGRSFQWMGRIDNVINSGGIKIIPELLEQRIRELLHAECLVLPQPDEKLGQKMVLLVEHPGPKPSVDDWSDLLRKHLDPHEVPKQVIPVREIPRNASFKPDRMAALRLYKNGPG
jgi:O-succinylbenzoic acid--CoA ligase